MKIFDLSKLGAEKTATRACTRSRQPRSSSISKESTRDPLSFVLNRLSFQAHGDSRPRYGAATHTRRSNQPGPIKATLTSPLAPFPTRSERQPTQTFENVGIEPSLPPVVFCFVRYMQRWQERCGTPFLGNLHPCNQDRSRFFCVMAQFQIRRERVVV